MNPKWTANFPRGVVEDQKQGQTRALMDIPKGILISICDPDSPEVIPSEVARSVFKNIYRFRFFDLNDEALDGSFTKLDAEKMAEVIRTNFDSNMYTHCSQGLCRSGAVTHVLQELGWSILRNSNTQIPNLLVKSRLLKEFGLGYETTLVLPEGRDSVPSDSGRSG